MKEELTQAELEYLNAQLTEQNPMMRSICQKVIRMAKEDKMIELGEIVNGTTEWSSEDDEPITSDMRNGSLSFSFNIENTPEMEQLFNEHREIHQTAQKMLDDIKAERQAYAECVVRNAFTRPSRRKAEKRLREKIAKFNAYCTKHNLKISRGE